MTNLILFILTCSFVPIISQNPLGSWTLQPNILVVDVDGSRGQQPLTCLEEDFLHGDNQTQIHWRKNGGDTTQRGNLYLIQLTESLGGGNYTCHSPDGSFLNHTEVLIQQVKTDRRILHNTKQGNYLTCYAKNHNGDFHCSWTWQSGRRGTVAFIEAQRASDDKNTQCSVDDSNLQWKCSSPHVNISCFVDYDRQEISCRDEQHCPYAEEIHRINLTIVKPDKVQINKVNKTLVEWTYPNSWSRPHSYFPLTFQILQHRRGCRKCTDPCIVSNRTKSLTCDFTDICQYKVKQRTVFVCVRAKDAFCNSQWSEWSHYRLKKHKKKNLE